MASGDVTGSGIHHGFRTIRVGIILMLSGPALALVLGLLGVGLLWLPILVMLATGVISAAIGLGASMERPMLWGPLVVGLGMACFSIALGLEQSVSAQAVDLAGLMGLLGSSGVLAGVTILVVGTSRRIRESRGRPVLSSGTSPTAQGAAPSVWTQFITAWGIAALSVSQVSLLILVDEHLPQNPGQHVSGSGGAISILAAVVLLSGLTSGVLTSWAQARGSWSRVSAGIEKRRRPVLLIPGVLLIAWSVERIVLGMAPRQVATVFGPQVMFGFEATVAAVIVLYAGFLGGYIVVQALTPLIEGS